MSLKEVKFSLILDKKPERNNDFSVPTNWRSKPDAAVDRPFRDNFASKAREDKPFGNRDRNPFEGFRKRDGF
jgi:hypothetical protein